MTRMRWFLLVLVSGAAVLAIGWLARAPYQPPGGDSAVLRLSWRLRGERNETCRPRTQAELDVLPVHMRTPQICEGALVAYRLTVRLDDRAADTSRVVPAGAKADRPIYVFDEKRLVPGPHRVRITFAREDSVASGIAAFSFDTVLNTVAGEVELITMDAGGHGLVHVSNGPDHVPESRMSH
jgi:hypothetical protein